ncbi:hypothetical protein ACTA71_005006 [Dictyostelium dimigraforme]
MSYVPSTKLIKDLVKQDCLKKNLYETTLAPEQRLNTKGSVEAIPIDSIKKSVYETALTNHCQKLGLKSYLEQMSHANLTTLYAPLRPALAEGEKDVKKNKVFLRKRITYAIIEDFNTYFEQLSGEEAKIFHAMTSSKNWTKIVEELTLVGLEIFLFTVQAKVLSEICANFKYDVQSNNPTLMVTSILMGSVPPKKETQPKKITFSKTKPNLKKGLTYHDIFQHYYVDELSEFCRKNGMKIAGNKRELIERILRFLNEGIKEVPKPKKSADAAEAEAEAEVEEEEEEEEEQEEAQEEEEEQEEEDNENVELVEEEKEVEQEEQEVVPEVVKTLPTKLKKSSSSQSKIVSPLKAKKSTK